MSWNMKRYVGGFAAVGLGLSGLSGCDEPLSVEQGPPGVGEAEGAVNVPPFNSFSWGPPINVTDVTVGPGHRTVATAPGQAFTVATDFFVGTINDPCINCETQLVFGAGSPGGTRECIYSGLGPVQSSAQFSLTAPPMPGIYPVWASPARTPDCATALASVAPGPVLGLVGVHGDPLVWHWGSVSNVKLNGNGSHKINVFPGAMVTITTDYSIDAAAGGCPGCISQVIFGIEQGSKACIYSGAGVVNQTGQSFTLVAPTSPGLYPVWSAAQWMFDCNQALSSSNGGTPLAFIEVK